MRQLLVQLLVLLLHVFVAVPELLVDPSSVRAPRTGHLRDQWYPQVVLQVEVGVSQSERKTDRVELGQVSEMSYRTLIYPTAITYLLAVFDVSASLHACDTHNSAPQCHASNLSIKPAGNHSFSCAYAMQ